MQTLDLYGEIQEYLDFKQEIKTLYQEIKNQVTKRDIKTLIDIGCGQGEFCNLLTQNGIDTYGVDLSSKQIELAKKKFPNLSFEALDIKNVSKTFECATATFDVINYIPQDQLKSFFDGTNKIVENKGYFIFDVNSFFGFDEIAQGSLIINNEEIFIGIDAVFEDETLYTDLFVFTKVNENYKKQTGTIHQFYYSKEVLESFLMQSGFTLVECVKFSLHDQENYDKMIFICKKEK